MENGVRLGWLVFPNDKKAYVYRPNQVVEELQRYDQSLLREEVLSGFTFDLHILK